MEKVWDDIIELEGVQDERQMLAKLISKSIGLSHIIGANDPLVKIMAHLISIQRYFLHLIPEQIDIDSTEYLSLLQKEAGFNLPLTEAIPIVEFLRESNSWNAHKGTEALYAFVSDVIGSPIAIHYPKKLILKLSDVTCLSGSTSDKGELDWEHTKLGRFRDGLLWSNFVYILDILQAQSVGNLNDLMALIEHIHPAGTKRQLNLIFTFEVDPETIPESTIYGFQEVTEDNYIISKPYPTLDNNWILSGSLAKLSMCGGDIWSSELDILEIPKLDITYCHKQLSHDTLMHIFPVDAPHIAFNRFVDKNDDTYEILYTESDSLLYENATTNMGVKDYNWEDIEDLEFREFADVAWALDKANMNSGEWFNSLLTLQIEEIE